MTTREGADDEYHIREALRDQQSALRGMLKRLRATDRHDIFESAQDEYRAIGVDLDRADGHIDAIRVQGDAARKRKEAAE
jgi:hypothetical protein